MTSATRDDHPDQADQPNEGQDGRGEEKENANHQEQRVNSGHRNGTFSKENAEILRRHGRGSFARAYPEGWMTRKTVRLPGNGARLVGVQTGPPAGAVLDPKDGLLKPLVRWSREFASANGGGLSAMGRTKANCLDVLQPHHRMACTAQEIRLRFAGF